MIRRLLAALLLAVGVALGAPGSATASCSGPAPGALPEGDGVFLGRVVEQRAGFDRFAVEEVWRGPDLAAQVWVQTGVEPPRWPWQTHAISTIDADLAPGVRYVVGLHGDFVTNTCAVVSASQAQITALRPDDARRPSADGAAGADPGRTWWPLAAAAVVLAAGAVVLSRRG